MKLYLLRIAVMAVALAACGQTAAPSATDRTTGAAPHASPMTGTSSGQVTPGTASIDTIVATGAATTAQVTPVPSGELAATPRALAPDQSPLANTSWKLESFGSPDQPQPLVANSAITITFQGADHVARGSAGCNSYGGTYAAGDTTLTFTDLAFTAMACDTPEVMEQEQRFQQALLTVERYRVEGNRLELVYDGGKMLRWVAAQ